MTGAEIITVLERKFGDKLKQKSAEAIDPFVAVEPSDLAEVCRFLRDESVLRFEMLNDISGVDYLETDAKKLAKAGYDPHMEVVYHVSSLANQQRFTVKVILPRWKNNTPGQLPELPSLCDIWPAANWHEREVFDLCGVDFVGHPNLQRILLSEDWEGHPLRKDYEFPLEYHGIRGR